jgi:acyl-coenzyme A thioesterase PaaI-like protein
MTIPPQHDPRCWGCGDNPTGIGLPRPSAEGAKRYEARFRFDDRHQAGPGIVHGGLVSAALDEACGLLATWYRVPSVTARIFVRYRHPVYIDRDLIVRSWVTQTRGRRTHVDGELLDDGEILAEARAAFLHVPLEHFLETAESRAARRRRRGHGE